MLTDTTAIGQRIRQFRKEKGLSQTELAEKIGKSLRTVQKYEKGEIDVSLSTIGEIGAVLDIPVQDILMKPESCKGRRKKETDSFTPFAALLRELLDEWGITQLILAKAIGVSRQSVGQWKDGKTVPDVLDLRKIADFFEVSADYLIGRTNIRAQDPEVRSISGKLGLSDKSVQMLARLNEESSPRLRTLDLLLAQAAEDITEHYGLVDSYGGSVLNAVCRYLGGAVDEYMSGEFEDYAADPRRYDNIRAAVEQLVLAQAIEALRSFDASELCHG